MAQPENEGTLVDKLLQNSDLFGGESDSEPDCPPARPPAPDLTPSTSEVVSTKRRKEKSRREEGEKKLRRLKKAEVQQLHSDSQRLIRESNLNLPKYQPKTKDLSSFLTKVRARRPQSTSVVTSLKSVSDLVKNGHSNKENCEDSLPTVDPCAPADHTPSHTATDKMEIETKLTREYGSSADPNPGGATVKDSDLSFGDSVSPRPTLELATDDHVSKQLKRKQSSLTSLFKHQPPAERAESVPTPSVTPQLSSLDEFLFEKDNKLTVELEPQRELTPLEKFQQRFTKHTVGLQPGLKPPSATQGEAALVPEELAAKLVDKPGAIREHLRCKLRQQLSQIRAEERKVADEVRRMYSEDVEEEEQEMTDADTSDEEYHQLSDHESMESDVSTDPDENDCGNNPSSDDKQDSDSVDDTLTLTKRKSVQLRILDSDEEEDSESEHTTSHCLKTEPSGPSDRSTEHRARPSLSTEESVSMFGPPPVSELMRRPSVLMSEASMPPLVLNTSSDSEDCDNDRGSLTVTTTRNNPSLQDEQPTGLTFDLVKDSGVGSTIRDKLFDDSQLTDDHSAAGQAEDSLEMSFRWPDGPSFPPAQPTRLESEGATFDPQSQCEEAQTVPPVSTATSNQSQEWEDGSLDEETQFLDADGFLCPRKEKRHAHSSSAIKASMDSSQPDCPSELLELCSGRFTPTDSTQGVRELLGLSTKPVGISGLQNDGPPGHNLSQLIGLCSGVFPPTQAPDHSVPHSKRSTSGTSDGHSSDSSDEESHLRERPDNLKTHKGAVLCQTEGEGYCGDSESEDEDMPLIKRRRVKLKVKKHKSERLAEFVESEAELSGSDVGSDEDDEILAEEEAGLFDEEEQSDVPLSDNELWDQVNKAHMKHTLADDKADLRDIKERFLKEGDLYEDGLALKNGFFRSRRYAQGAGSEAGSVDLFSEGGLAEEDGGEGDELSSQLEARRRKERLEREEFMSKCREKNGSLLAMDEDSQSILSIIVDNSSQSVPTTPHPVRSGPVPTPSLTSSSKRSRGSFLKHDANTLRRLSSLTAVTPKPGGVSSGCGFVFHKKPGALLTDGSLEKAQQPKKRSRSSLLDTESKRPKLDRSLSTPTDTSSIFTVLK